MKNQLDHFLLGLLWLLACTLGVSFWFNTKYGFNIFSIPHWQYLGTLQASGTPVKTGLYISMVIAVIIMMIGLYIILRPKFRKIRLAKPEEVVILDTPADSQTQQPETQITDSTAAPISLVRPPRLEASRMSNTIGIASPGPVPAAHAVAPITPPVSADMAMAPKITVPLTPGNNSNGSADFAHIEKIFTDAGYLVKKPPRIRTLRPALYAIGASEAVWIGAVGIEPARLAGAIDALNQIFVETLEDIKINIFGFVISPKPDAVGVDTSSIMRFDSVQDLAAFMADHPADPILDDEKSDFDAYSEYIDTVSDYFNKT